MANPEKPQPPTGRSEPGMLPLPARTPTDDDLPDFRLPRNGVRKGGPFGKRPRRRLLGSGEGDYCIYVISDGKDGNVNGHLIPYPGIPRFTSSLKARKWIEEESRDLLENKQVIIFKACDIIHVVPKKEYRIELLRKTKVEVPREEEYGAEAADERG